MVIRKALSFQEEQLAFIDDYCERNNIKRSTFMVQSAIQTIKAQETMPLVNEMMKQLGKTLASNNWTDKEIKELEKGQDRLLGQMSFKQMDNRSKKKK